MNCSMKSNLGKLLADALRYYYFDVYVLFHVKMKAFCANKPYFWFLLCSICFCPSSDSLVEQAAGGKSAAESFRETDEKGFRDSEVYYDIHKLDHEMILHHVSSNNLKTKIISFPEWSSKAVIMYGPPGSLCWWWCRPKLHKSVRLIFPLISEPLSIFYL